MTFTSCVTNVQHKSFEDLQHKKTDAFSDLLKVVTNEQVAEKKIQQSLNNNSEVGLDLLFVKMITKGISTRDT